MSKDTAEKLLDFTFDKLDKAVSEKGMELAEEEQSERPKNGDKNKDTGEKVNHGCQKSGDAADKNTE